MNICAKWVFSDLHPRAYFLHDDKDGQHIHILASRISYDGKLYLGKNENLISTKIIGKLEQKFGLTQTKGNGYGGVTLRASAKLTKKEIEKAVRIEKAPARRQLQNLVMEALKRPVTATHFVELLQAGGVNVGANIASTGRLNGFKFGLEGVWFSGSKLGKDFTYAALANRGLNYEQDRDGEFLSKLGAGRGDDKSYAGATDRSTSVQAGYGAAARGDNGAEKQPSPASTAPANTLPYRNKVTLIDLGTKHAGNDFSSTAVGHSSGVAPGKSGNRIADELLRAVHKSRLEEARKGAQANQKYLIALAEQDALDQSRKAKHEQEEKAKQKSDSEHEKMAFMNQGLGFAMKQKIKIKGVKNNGTEATGKQARRNTSEISTDAAPRSK